MKYPVNCNKCTQALSGPVKYCPFCGEASPSITATDDKQNLDTLRSEISSLLGAGKYDPDIRGAIRQKGKAIGISEAAADSLLLEVLKEKGFGPVEDGTNDPLAVKWCTAERTPKEGTAKQPEPKTTEETQPKSTALRLSETRIDFDGVDVGSGLRNKTVSYEKIGDHPLAGSISSDANFLTVTPSSLSPSSGAIEVALDTNKVQPGQVYSQQIRIKYNGADNALSIPVQIRVNPRPAS